MKDLDELLTLLREGAQAVVLQSGQPIRVRSDGEETPVSDVELTASAIQGILHGTPAQSCMPRHDTAGEETKITIGSRRYRFKVARFLDLLEIRIMPVDSPPTKGPSSEDSGLTLARLHPTPRRGGRPPWG